MAEEKLLVIDDSPTVLNVVESALTRAGYQVDAAGDWTTALEAARRGRPVAILIDSFLGAATGSKADGEHAGAVDAPVPRGCLELCEALARDDALSQTPVVLMTVKGEDLETLYAHLPNVVDYIAKPFSPDAIVGLVTHVVRTTDRGGGGRGRDRGDGGGNPPRPGSDQSRGHPAAAARGTGQPAKPSGAVAQALSQSLGSGPTSVLGRLRTAIAERLERFRQESGTSDLSQAVNGGLTDEVLRGLLADAGFHGFHAQGPLGSGSGVAGAGRVGPPDLAGRLESVPLSEIIALLGQQTETGTLRVLTDSSRVEIFFNRGRIDLAAAVGVAEEFLLGRFAVEAGHITPEGLARVLDERARIVGNPPLFGRDLTARGLITPEQLKAAMTRQTAELAYETLRWSRGSFQFQKTDDLPELAEDASLNIAVDTLLLEGFRRVDEWRLIERDIQNFDLVFLRAEDRLSELPRGTLTRDEIAVLDALSGKNSVRDVIRSLRMGSFDVSKILFRLLRTKLIRRRIQPVAAS